jgi:hypothetical protein
LVGFVLEAVMVNARSDDDDDFQLDDFDDGLDIPETDELNNDDIFKPAAASPARKRKWRDAEEYREWKRLRDLLGEDDLGELDF